MPLTDAQVAMLNILVYWPDVADEENNGKSLAHILRRSIDRLESGKHDALFDKNGKEGLGPGIMSKGEWLDALQQAANDPSIANLTFNHAHREADTDAFMTCFVTKDKQKAHAVFRGTSQNEWHDNGKMMTEADGQQNQRALAWFRAIEDLYPSFTVSGHSKGGNKAQYILVTADTDKITDCIALDAPGFSAKFLEKYASKIQQVRARIRLYAHAKDFVNVFGHLLTDNIQFSSNKRGVSGGKDYHAPNSLFRHDDNGNLMMEFMLDENKQDKMMSFLRHFFIHLDETLSEANKFLVYSFAGVFLQLFLGKSNPLKGMLHQFSDVNEFISFIVDLLNDNAITRFGKKLSLALQKLLSAFDDFAKKGIKIPDAIREIITFILTPLRYAVAATSIGDGVASGYYLLKDAFKEMIMNAEERFSAGSRGKFIVSKRRDFSRAAREMILRQAEQAEKDDGFSLDFRQWDAYIWIQDKLGLLSLSHCKERNEKIWRRRLDLANAGKAQMERVFDAVYEIDRQYAEKIEHRFSRFQAVNGVLIRCHEGIHIPGALVTVEGSNERKPEIGTAFKGSIDLTGVDAFH